MRFGIPYQGSKNRIAEWVVEQLPASHTLVDLFAGGCAVTHAALLSRKWEKVVANDRTSAPQVFVDAINGEFSEWSLMCDREEFMALKDVDDAVALLFSFGNNRNSYMFGAEIEKVKVPAERMLTAPSVRERYTWFKAFIRALKSVEADGAESAGECLDNLKRKGLGRLERLQRLQGLQGLERLQGLGRLQGPERLERLEVTRMDYRDVVIPDGATVYADPPYRGVGAAAYKQFNFDAFDGWLESVSFPVYVSEYTAPRGCIEVTSKQKVNTMSASGKSQHVVEKLFVQERFAHTAGGGSGVGLFLKDVERGEEESDD